VLLARVRRDARVGAAFGFWTAGFPGCFSVALAAADIFADWRTGLRGSTAGGLASVFGRGVDPDGVGVHLVPLPVM
jgi:hypothetical protein